MSDGQGVKVAIVDSGIALAHPDLIVAGGACTVHGEDPGSYDPLGGPHGTHCAGIVAARGTPEISVTGPGVGVISTVPESAYAVMSGTSMATPAVTGLAARMLAKDGQLLNSNRDAARADAIAKALLQSCKKLGFGPDYEGQGLPQG